MEHRHFICWPTWWNVWVKYEFDASLRIEGAKKPNSGPFLIGPPKSNLRPTSEKPFGAEPGERKVLGSFHQVLGSEVTKQISM
jgi:hypothetical protein